MNFMAKDFVSKFIGFFPRQSVCISIARFLARLEYKRAKKRRLDAARKTIFLFFILLTFGGCAQFDHVYIWCYETIVGVPTCEKFVESEK